jgi:hypothetical protein
MLQLTDLMTNAVPEFSAQHVSNIESSAVTSRFCTNINARERFRADSSPNVVVRRIKAAFHPAFIAGKV